MMSGQAARPARRLGDREQEIAELNSKVPVRAERNNQQESSDLKCLITRFEEKFTCPFVAPLEPQAPSADQRPSDGGDRCGQRRRNMARLQPDQIYRFISGATVLRQPVASTMAGRALR
jgi:hypothetical protein